MSWGAEDVAQALREAAEVLAELPATGCRPNGFAPASAGFYAPPSISKRRPLNPTEVSAMDGVLRWPDILPSARDRQIVRLRADGHTWRLVGMKTRLSHVGARKVANTACTAIARALNLGSLAVPAGVRVPAIKPLPIAA
ncbi:hypothetical protein [Acidisoma cladoniae]|uniref:hypothetical protein n=1 Tax=Acidisoma cladoniae TaxID=3040935 RepID=UPI0025501671|nr:hypothetical protein [Acidisoma sp. PAMC 29798]